MIIDELINRLEAFKMKLDSGELVRRIIKENDYFIIDLNAETQLYEQGVNNLGVSIDDYAPYSELTIEIKESKGQPTDRVTLRDEGDFHSSFYIEAGAKFFEVKASDEKTKGLIKKYGRQILGLTDENIRTLIDEVVLPEIRDALKKAIHG